jgi:hypothetical protein
LYIRPQPEGRGKELPDIPSQLETTERRRKPMRCRECGSTDVWRIGDGPDTFFASIIYRDKKPFQCRKCLYRFYQYARREADTEAPVRNGMGKRALISWSVASTLVLMTLSLAALHWGGVPGDAAVPARTVVKQGTLTNADIIRLKNAGLGDGVIKQKIRSVPGNYTVGANDLVGLKRAGLSDDVISAMLDVMGR